MNEPKWRCERDGSRMRNGRKRGENWVNGGSSAVGMEQEKVTESDREAALCVCVGRPGLPVSMVTGI